MAKTSQVARPAEQILRPREEELLKAWRELVEANAEQVARLREFDELEDYWAEGYAGAPVSMDSPSATDRTLAWLAGPDECWLDIGAGYGRWGIPLSRHVQRITAVDPSPGLTKTLKDHLDRLGVQNVDVLEPDFWPPEKSPGRHDVCLAINVVNFVAEIGPFLDAMEQHAGRLCVVGATERGTAWQPVEPLFEELHGERFIRLPALQDFLSLLGARRRRFDIQTHDDMPAAMREPQDLDTAHQRVRSYYLVREGSANDVHLRTLLDRHFGLGDGRVQLPLPQGSFSTLISWAPPSG